MKSTVDQDALLHESWGLISFSFLVLLFHYVASLDAAKGEEKQEWETGNKQKKKADLSLNIAIFTSNINDHNASIKVQNLAK